MLSPLHLETGVSSEVYEIGLSYHISSGKQTLCLLCYMCLCQDIDECRVGSFDCEPNSVCRNLVGDYYCTCRMGYRLDDSRQRCVRDTDFIYDDLLQVPALEKPQSVQTDWRMSQSLPFH